MARRVSRAGAEERNMAGIKFVGLSFGGQSHECYGGAKKNGVRWRTARRVKEEAEDGDWNFGYAMLVG